MGNAEERARPGGEVSIEELRLELAAAIKARDVVRQQAIRALLDRMVGPKAEKETRYEIRITASGTVAQGTAPTPPEGELS